MDEAAVDSFDEDLVSHSDDYDVQPAPPSRRLSAASSQRAEQVDEPSDAEQLQPQTDTSEPADSHFTPQPESADPAARLSQEQYWSVQPSTLQEDTNQLGSAPDSQPGSDQYDALEFEDAEDATAEPQQPNRDYRSSMLYSLDPAGLVVASTRATQDADTGSVGRATRDRQQLFSGYSDRSTQDYADPLDNEEQGYDRYSSCQLSALLLTIRLFRLNFPRLPTHLQSC